MRAQIRHLNIEVTRKCNQHCFYCFNNSGRSNNKDELSVSQWLSILHNLQHGGLESVHLTGGEPFVYKSAVDLLAGAQALGLSTSILSNGLRLGALVCAYPEVFCNLSVAQISLDSMNEKTHNARRGNDRAWNDAVAAIHALRRLSIPVEISCVVSDANLADLIGVAEFCELVGAALLIRPIVPKGRAASLILKDGFAKDVDIFSKGLAAKYSVELVSDRFHYVVDDRALSAIDAPIGICTAAHDGSISFGNL